MALKPRPSDGDRRLITLCASGDDEAWDHLLKEYGCLIYNIVSRYGKRRQDRNELYIFVIENIWRNNARKLTAWEGRAKFSNYLVSVVSRLCLDYFKGQVYNEEKRYESLDDVRNARAAEQTECASSLHPGTQHYVIHKECQGLIEDVMTTLEQEDRAILILFYWQGMKYREIAAVMQMSMSDIGKRLIHAREKLRLSLVKRGIKNIADLLE
ncbi:MAG: sigma-70 family RNA polymerase sigma factor [Candidatus Aureabacteria bacterium]|nr:sigma-70 family RNA polymerase sigma factor [Candidatus Auribacterota bacterium]